MPDQDVSRRSILRVGAAGAIGVGATAVVAACSSDKAATSPTSAASTTGSAETSSAATSAAGTSAAASGAAAGAPSGTKVAQLSDVPVGNAVSKTLDGKPIILSQPTAGKVVALSAICTHQGCTVAPADKQLQCPCHQSAFDFTTGQPEVNTATGQAGPAQSPLESYNATVFQGAVYVSDKS